MEACGTTESCEFCTKRNRCNRRGNSTESEIRETYYPDFCAIEMEEEREEKRFREKFKNFSW